MRLTGDREIEQPANLMTNEVGAWVGQRGWGAVGI